MIREGDKLFLHDVGELDLASSSHADIFSATAGFFFFLNCISLF